jgi:hypothetical protein
VGVISRIQGLQGDPTPTLALPLKGRETLCSSPFKGEVRRGMGYSLERRLCPAALLMGKDELNLRGGLCLPVRALCRDKEKPAFWKGGKAAVWKRFSAVTRNRASTAFATY